MATDDQERGRCCFLKWMNLQEQELSELHQALTVHSPNNENEDNFSQLAEKCIEHFQDYADKRSQLAHNDVFAFFAPACCTNWENSLLWLAGCRPSQYIRLVYALCGLEIEMHLSEFLQGTSSSSANLGYVSNRQFHLIKHVTGEDAKVRGKVDKKDGELAGGRGGPAHSGDCKGVEPGGGDERGSGQSSRQTQATVAVLEEADRLRLSTLKELIGILTPRQAADFLAVSKKLHLCVHQWGKERDLRHGSGSPIRK